ncbi:UDP-glucuronosyltransferase 2B7 [Anoplophora glabripennis]|uniref:UDP-glucuronosyltransferase 2B7 n=1 Tax=Anoplophora glabripennis TaxID=217634 RepID=UPI00087558CF|nr:UDP-glucuronosyltransferase 2B7 [Anoplophora glabripennis]
MDKYLLLLLVLSLASSLQCARILGVFQMPTVSHQSVFQSLWKELSLRGHDVTVVTPYPLKDPRLVNLTEIDMSYASDSMKRHGFQFFMRKEFAVHTKIPKIFAINYDAADAIFSNTEFIKIYNNSNEKFDVILVQTYISPIMYSLGYKLGAPVIGVASMGGYVGSHYAMGNPNPPSLYSEMFLPYNGKLTFYERFCSTLYYIWLRFYLTFVAIPRCDEIARKYLGNDMPYMGEIEKNLSLLFLTTNPIFYPPRPTVPTIIPLQRLHIKPPKPLPKDLQTILDNAKNGVIFFSLGSNVQSVNMPDRLRIVLNEAFSELPYTILWKYESVDLPGKPSNVIIKKWLPQQDVLAHPNIRAFISQTGLQSTEEAIDRGVPIIGMPFIADQSMNTRVVAEIGIGVGVDYETVTKEELKNAIIEVAENEKYKRNIEKLRDLMLDEQVPPMEKAIWWIEYVIRHKGTKHLRSPTVDISWIEYFLIDIAFVVLLISTIIIYSIYKIVKVLRNCNKATVKKNGKND